MKLRSCYPRRGAFYAWVVAVVLAVAIRPARATTIAQIDLAALVRGADAVVHAVVERTGTQMAYNASVAPWSVTQLRVLRWLKGRGGERIWIRDPGAIWANGGRPVIGAAVYSAGEEVIVFLRKDEGGFFRTHNLAGGKLLVRRDGAQPVVEQNLQDVSVLVTPQQTALADIEPASSASTSSSVIAQGERRVLAPLPEVLSQLEVLLGARK